MNVDILLVIAVISAITEAIKKLTMAKYPYLASFLALLFGIFYVGVLTTQTS